MSTVTASFTATGVGNAITIRPGETFTYVVSNTFDATWQIQREAAPGVYEAIATGTGTAASTTVKNSSFAPVKYRAACTAFTSGTVDVSLADVSGDALSVPAPGQPFVVQTSDGTTVMRVAEDGVRVLPTSKALVCPVAVLAKVGGTAGWVVGAASNVALATCPASQTGSKLIVPITGLKVGSTVTGFSLVGQVESAGNAVTIDADLRKQTAAAADVTDASLGTMTQISVTADTAITAANSTHTLSSAEVIADGENLYMVITATTLGSTDIALQAVTIYYKDAELI